MVKKHITDRYFWYIYDGEKLAEGREISDFWNLNLLGQIITFHNGEQEFDCRITRCHAYVGMEKEDAVRNMLLYEGIKNMLPDVDDMESAVSIYMSFGDNVNNKVGAFYLEVISGIRPYQK
jgi:ASC-1-like (ASCH) protein